MKNASLVLAAPALFVAACAPVPAPDSSGAPADLGASATAMDAAAFELFDRVRAGGQSDANVFVSPLSVQQAMGLVHAGARGRTAAQIEQALGLPAGSAADTVLQQQRQALEGSTGSVNVRIANALWLSNAFRFHQPYLDQTRSQYAAKAATLDFAGNRAGSARTINAWVKDSTSGLIDEVIKAESLDAGTLAVLTNAVFFEGKWVTPFEAAYERPFLFGSGREAPFPQMHEMLTVAYAEADGWKAVRLPYASDNRFAMDVFVPIRRQAGGVLSARTYATLTARLDAAKSVPVNVALPRFEIDWDGSLNAVLQAQGVVDAFSAANADLSGIAATGGRRPFISEVSHASKLQVFETGTKAAAVTAVTIVVTSSRITNPPPKEFKADQPFTLAIRDVKNSVPLFIGRIAQPKPYAAKPS